MFTSGACALAQPGPSSILKSILEHADSTRPSIVLVEGIIEPIVLLDSFYRPRQYSLAWHEQWQVEEFIRVIERADEDGLNPEDYHFQALKNYAAKPRSVREAAFFDLLLTDAFLSYASHMLYGKVDPTVLYPGKWEIVKPHVDIVLLLRNALTDQALRSTLEDLKPAYKAYEHLKAALSLFMNIKSAGSWISVPDGGPVLEPGMIDAAIPAIRKRLGLTGQLGLRYQPSNELRYDSILFFAVMKFQQQHGLRVDGVIGAGTRMALHSSVDEYIQTIKLNLERYRWLPKRLENRYLWVNIPAFNVDLLERDSLILSMRAILGRQERKTPVISSTIRRVIYNPVWTVPPTILEQDVLPAIKKDKNYLLSHHLRVIDRNGNEVAAESIRWSGYTATNFPFTLRQDPGPFNALGLIKFEFHNNHTVFLHDTNMPALFNETSRALSSGCIRIDKPFELAMYVLKGTSWSASILQEAIDAGVTGSIVIPDPLAIHIVYFTAFVDSDDQLQMRNDIYGWDSRLLQELINAGD